MSEAKEHEIAAMLALFCQLDQLLSCCDRICGLFEMNFRFGRVLDGFVHKVSDVSELH